MQHILSGRLQYAKPQTAFQLLTDLDFHLATVFKLIVAQSIEYLFAVFSHLNPQSWAEKTRT